MATVEELLGLIDLQHERHHRIDRMIENARKSGQLKTIAGLQARLGILESHWAQFQAEHRPIRASRYKELRESEYIKQDLFGATEELYLQRKIELQEILEPLENAKGGLVQAAANPAALTESPLPRIPIPRFSGTFDEWRNFKSLFTSLVGENTSLSSVHKLHYLKQNVTGEPERLLRNYLLTEDGFNSAWKALCDRYDNRRLLVDAYMGALLSLGSIRRESLSETKRLLDRSCEIRTSLSQLDCPVAG